MRDELAHRRLSQRVAAERLEQLTGETWTQSKVHKILTAQVELRVDDLAAFARLLDLSLAELMREPGREFVADMTPTELRVLEMLRDNPGRDLVLLQLFGDADRRKPGRRTIRERMQRKG